MKNVSQFDSYAGKAVPYICAKDYYLNYAGTECIAATRKDKNCRRLHDNKVDCAECNADYYFDGNTCELKAALYIVNALVAALLFMSF